MANDVGQRLITVADGLNNNDRGKTTIELAMADLAALVERVANEQNVTMPVIVSDFRLVTGNMEPYVMVSFKKGGLDG